MQKMKARKHIYLDVLGCKLNQAETEKLSSELEACGCTLVSSVEEADVYILNTCTVTHVADRKSRQLLRSAKRKNPRVLVLALGCYPEAARGEIEALKEVDYVFDNKEKKNLIELIRTKGILDGEVSGGDFEFKRSRSRSFIKIQEGCENFCTYCIVPYVRNEVLCVKPDEIIKEIKQKELNGYKEVVLTGTEIGNYRFGSVGLAELVKRVLKETSIERIRLSSLQPNHINRELISLWEDKRLCPHFHLSLQSGSDSVLKRMGRCYETKEYAEAVALIRRHVKDAAITTDVIAGFPGETEKEFLESYGFCEKMQFARMHIFPYSKRAGTKASKMEGHVAEKVKKERANKMLALAKRSAQAFGSGYIGAVMEVLWEGKTANGLWQGLTGNYIRVYTKSEKDLENKVTDAKLVKQFEDGLLADFFRE